MNPIEHDRAEVADEPFVLLSDHRCYGKNCAHHRRRLAGSEAAWQLARRGVAVELFEMRPQRRTEAHATANLGELVCSNSLRSDSLSAPAGLLKAEMRQLDSLVIRVAEAHRVPAGSALAVDRDRLRQAR